MRMRMEEMKVTRKDKDELGSWHEDEKDEDDGMYLLFLSF